MARQFVSYSEITMADVTRQYPAVSCIREVPPERYGGLVLALAQACWESPPAEAYDERQHFLEQVSRSTSPGNLWITPTRPRMVYPLAPYWALACCFATEREEKRRFDWFVWADDDAVFSMKDVGLLIDAAGATGAKFVSALPYDRMPPHQPAVCEEVGGKIVKWVKAPPSGTHPVFMTGLLLAVFHRSIFEEVPEPWFGVLGPMRGFSGIMPDWWWCLQMQKAGKVPYVCCDTDVTHLGLRSRVNRKLSEERYEREGVPPCAVAGKLTPVPSPSTGAIVVPAPIHHDGRIENAPAARPDWSDSTVVIITCDRDKELLDLCLKGIKVFWPDINVAVLRDKDAEHETDLPEDIREIIGHGPFLRKVFDLPFLSKTDKIYCLDSDCLLFETPTEWVGYRGLYVLPGSAGQDWLNKGADVWETVGKTLKLDLPPIDRTTIFCGGCWSASVDKMFKPTRDIAIEYVRECVRRGYDNPAKIGYAVICEQVLLNGLWHLAHPKNPLPNYRFPLDEPNPQMAIYHLHMTKDSPETRRRLDLYRDMIEAELRRVEANK